MKFLFFLLSFAAIVAFGVTCVAPMLKECIEGDLAARAESVLKEPRFSDKYTITNVKIDHFHAKQVTISPKDALSKLDRALVRREIVDSIDPILGIYAKDLVLVNAEPKENPDHKIAKAPTPGPPPPDETPNTAIVMQPPSFSFKWLSEEKKLLLDGRQTNKHTSTELIEFFKEAKKQPQTESSIKIDTNKVANSKYLKRALRDIRLLIINSHDDLDVEFQDALKTSDGDHKGYLKFKGTTGTLEKYEALTKSIQNLESEDFEVHNELVFYPYISIKKDALKEKVILTGCVKYRTDQGMLGSNASRDVTNNFSTDNKLTTHKRCLDITWLDEHMETLIAKHMSKVTDGEIIFRNNKLYSLSGISHDTDYVAEVNRAYKGSDVAKKLIYKEAPQKNIELVEPDPARPNTLAEQLKEYKIFFESGKSEVDPRYSAQLDDIASKIKASTDKTSQILIGGYADTSGYAEHNKALSLKRARAVMSKLVGRGVEAKRIEVEFFGAEANGKTKAESRRVEIKVRKK